MRILGAEVRPATSGSRTLKDATNEAMRHWINNPDDTHYIIGSVVGPHPYPDMVARFQSVISEELLGQLKKVEGRDYPDFVIACVGGGSNAAGIFYHYLDNPKVNLVGVEAAGLGVSTDKSAATTKLGKKGVLHGSKTLLMQDENGQRVEEWKSGRVALRMFPHARPARRSADYDHMTKYQQGPAGTAKRLQPLNARTGRAQERAAC